jgi:ABC-type transport system involved in cytochrome bd biosynthesis fused ATPase/permease subunit
MERLLQYLDDLDDLCGAFGLAWEKMRRILLRVVSIAMISAAGAAAIGLALVHPPIALATSTMLFVVLLYRSVTVPSKKWASVA